MYPFEKSLNVTTRKLQRRLERETKRQRKRGRQENQRYQKRNKSRQKKSFSPKLTRPVRPRPSLSSNTSGSDVSVTENRRLVLDAIADARKEHEKKSVPKVSDWLGYDNIDGDKRQIQFVTPPPLPINVEGVLVESSPREAEWPVLYDSIQLLGDVPGL